MAFALVLAATRGGALAVNFDSVYFVSAARNLAAGRGLVDFSLAPLIHWPPGLSALLAAGVSLGLGIETSGRLINAVSAALIVWCTFLLGARKLPTRRLAVVAGGVVALTPALLRVEFTIFTEPLFTVFVLVFVLMIDTARSRQPLLFVTLAGLSAGFATLVRYHGLALVLAGLVLIVLGERRRIRRCAVELALFSSAVAVVVVPWLLRNYEMSGRALTTGGSTEGIGPTTKALFVALARLVAPFAIPETLAVIAVIAIMTLVSATMLLWWSALRSSVATIASWLIVLVALVGFVFASCVVGSSDLNARILAPTVPLLVLYLLWLHGTLSRLAALGETPRRERRIVAAAGSIVLAAVALYGIWVAWSHGGQGRGFAAASVRDSELVQAVRELPANTTVLTDDPLPITYWTNRVPTLVPGRGSPNGLGQQTVTPREIVPIACRGRVVYARTLRPSAAVRFFDRAARGRLVFEHQRRLADGNLLRVRVAHQRVCDNND
jgi:4-amino-4-deoxy-L-arabinose transferase-like glycosyltransferase